MNFSVQSLELSNSFLFSLLVGVARAHRDVVHFGKLAIERGALEVVHFPAAPNEVPGAVHVELDFAVVDVDAERLAHVLHALVGVDFVFGFEELPGSFLVRFVVKPPQQFHSFKNPCVDQGHE